MASGSSKLVIVAGMAGNLAIAITKFIAAYLTRSSAMLSEGIHSLVDTGNGVFLLHGIRQSQLPADEDHPFGHGKELYFWTLIVAVLIFALGGGISIYQGINHMIHPAPVGDVRINYIVLLLSFFFEGAAWYIALREFTKMKGSRGYLRAIRESKDPTTFTVLFEDSAAMLGLIVAFVGIFLGDQLGMPILDGVASLIIGIILCLVSIFLASESKGLLIGEGVDARTRASIRRFVDADPAVKRLVRALSMHLGPSEVLMTLEIEFQQDLTAASITNAVERLDRAIRTDHPEVKHLFLEAQSIRTRGEILSPSLTGSNPPRSSEADESGEKIS